MRKLTSRFASLSSARLCYSTGRTNVAAASTSQQPQPRKAYVLPARQTNERTEINTGVTLAKLLTNSSRHRCYPTTKPLLSESPTRTQVHGNFVSQDTLMHLPTTQSRTMTWAKVNFVPNISSLSTEIPSTPFVSHGIAANAQRTHRPA